MGKYRALIHDDKVRIIGPWIGDGITGSKHGSDDIGKIATVFSIANYGDMPVRLRVPGRKGFYYWCRENLRALPRGKHADKN